MAVEKLIKFAVLVAVLLSQTAFAGDPFQGAQIYNARCAMCHGANGKAMVAGTPDFVRTNILAKPDFELKNFINAGKGIMPGFQGVLKDQEILDVISYIRTFN
jgi:cytochrome c6